MDFIALLIGLGPLLGWGCSQQLPLNLVDVQLTKSSGRQWVRYFAIVLALVKGIGIPGGMALVFSIISGAGWAFGQIITFKAFELVGSSRAMPITTAFQLLGASLWGVFALGNWPGVANKVVGFVALIVILIGARMTV